MSPALRARADRTARANAGRIGSRLFLAAGALTVVNNFIPPLERVNRPALFAIGLGAIACGLVSARAPWTRWPQRATLALPVVALALITLADLFGGVSAYSYAVYYVVVFAYVGMTQAPRTSIALCPLAVAGYVAPPLLRAAIPTEAALSATVAIPVCVLVGEVISRTTTRLREAQAQLEHRAALLAHVARTHRAMSTVDADAVLESVVDAALGLGFEAAEICMFDEQAALWRSVHARNVPATYVGRSSPIETGIAGLVRDERATVVIDDYSTLATGTPEFRREGFHVVIGAPIWSQTKLVAALVTGTRERPRLVAEDVEAFELLAGHAGRALENARLFEDERRTVEKLAELDRMKDDFITTVSHELRTPVAVIKGLGLTVEGRWRELDAFTRRELLRRMNVNAAALESIIETLLDFSRVHAGQMETSIEPQDVGELIRSVIGRVGSLFAAHFLDIDTEAGLIAYGDRILLERLLENLLSNAARHTPPGTRVRVSAGAIHDGIVVSVEDTGPGISPEELRHIGEKFFRGGHPDRRASRGTGLGLAFVKKILELHASELRIESRVGQGSRFSFSLAAAQPAGATSRSESSHSRRAASSS